MAETFVEHLTQTKSRNTARAYLESLIDFERWFEAANGEPLSPIRLTPTDAREYRQAMAERKLAPATINLRLAAGWFFFSRRNSCDGSLAKSV